MKHQNKNEQLHKIQNVEKSSATNQNAAINVCISAVIAALLVGVKFVFAFIPNIEMVTPLIIVFTVSLGFKRTIFGVLAFCLLDNLLYGFYYLVTIQYFFHFPLLCILTSLLSKKWKDSDFCFAYLAAIMAVLFWIETPIINAVLKFSPFIPTLVAGIPFMIPMLICNFLSLLFLYKPLKSVLTKGELAKFSK